LKCGCWRCSFRRRVDGQSSSLYFSITDGQFSTVAVLGESANLLERVSYLAYGLATHQWPGDFDGNGYDGFGMYYNGAQVYGGLVLILGSAAVISAGGAAAPVLVASGGNRLA
jgi:hypothetical protein